MRLALSLCFGVLASGCTGWQSGALAIDRVTPASGPSTSDVAIEIDGTGFHLPITSNLDRGTTVVGTMSVAVGSAPLPDAARVSDQQLEGTVPAGLPEGSYDLTVTIGDRSAVLAGGYTVTGAGAGGGLPPDAGSGSPLPPMFVQGTGNVFADSASIAQPFQTAQAAGNLNLVVVSWFGGTGVSSVTDSDGNTYTEIGAAVTSSGFGTEDCYYAANIHGGATANTITVTFAGTMTRPEVRILEYQGLARSNPLDVTAVATQTSTTAVDSGPATTTNANDLIVGADYVEYAVVAPGPGFTTRVTVSYDSVEDMLAASAGAYDATATQSAAGRSVMRLIAFRAGP